MCCDSRAPTVARPTDPGEPGLKIRGEAVDLPVAVAGRIEAAATVDFLRSIEQVAVAFGAACHGLGECALGGRHQWPLLGRSMFSRVCCGRCWRSVIGWHCS
jgi:hypothetical protein